MCLIDGVAGALYRIENIAIDDAAKHRLEALGMVSGTQVRILTRKRGGSMVILVRGTRFALGKEFAKRIFANSL